MLASLSIEAISHDTYQQMRLWSGVCRECGIGRTFDAAIGKPEDFARWGVWEIDGDRLRLVYGRTDYSHANSKGSRGVRIWYALESGKRYHVKSPTSWKNSDEYDCHVTEGGDVVRE